MTGFYMKCNAAEMGSFTVLLSQIESLHRGYD